MQAPTNHMLYYRNESYKTPFVVSNGTGGTSGSGSSCTWNRATYAPTEPCVRAVNTYMHTKLPTCWFLCCSEVLLQHLHKRWAVKRQLAVILAYASTRYTWVVPYMAPTIWKNWPPSWNFAILEVTHSLAASRLNMLLVPRRYSGWTCNGWCIWACENNDVWLTSCNESGWRHKYRTSRNWCFCFLVCTMPVGILRRGLHPWPHSTHPIFASLSRWRAQASLLDLAGENKLHVQYWHNHSCTWQVPTDGLGGHVHVLQQATMKTGTHRDWAGTELGY